MIKGLTVVTHTNPSSGRDISKCVESVKAALPPHSRHLIIDTEPSVFREARYEAMQHDEVVVMVDDDDHISPDSLKLCLQALNDTGAGLAFTYEVMVRRDGTQICNQRRVSYSMMTNHPQVVHQLCAIRTSCVTSRSIETARRYHGLGIEWIMKTEAGIFHDAVQIPIKGYFWVQHPGQLHLTNSWQEGVRLNLKAVSTEMRAWSDRTDMIPVYSKPLNI